MKGVFEEYGIFMIQFIVATALIALLIGLFTLLPGAKSTETPHKAYSGVPMEAEYNQKAGNFTSYNEKVPQLEIATGVYVEQGSSLNLLGNDIILEAKDASGRSLRDKVKIVRIVNAETGEVVETITENEVGVFDITYCVVDSKNNRAKAKARIIIEEATMPEQPGTGGDAI